MILEVILALLLPSILYFVYEYIEHLLNLKNYPNGPFPLPIIGNLHMLTAKPYEDLARFAKIYGDVFSISFGMKRMVIVNSIEPIREVLVDKGYLFAGRPTDVYTSNLISRNNLSLGFSDYGPYWKMLRRIIHSSLKIYGDGMQKMDRLIVIESEELHNVLKQTNEKPVDPGFEIGVAILNVICQITFGHRYERNDPEFKDIIKFQRLIFQGLGLSEAVAFLPWLKYFPLQGIKRLKQGVAIRDPIYQRKVKEHLENFDPDNIRDFTDGIIKLARDENYLKKFGISIKIEEKHLEMWVNDIFVGGNETLITTIRWFIVYMLHWPENQDKIYNEMIKVVGHDKYPTLEDRDKLHLFNACIYECLRMSVIAPLGVPRKATDDTHVNGMKILKDTKIILNFWNLQMSDSFWEKPNEFNANRWLDENGEIDKYDKYKTFLPFSAGVRGCPGEVFAKMELFLFLSRLYKDFRTEKPEGDPLPNLVGDLGITLTPKPFNVIFKSRNNNVQT